MVLCKFNSWSSWKNLKGRGRFFLPLHLLFSSQYELLVVNFVKCPEIYIKVVQLVFLKYLTKKILGSCFPILWWMCKKYSLSKISFISWRYLYVLEINKGPLFTLCFLGKNFKEKMDRREKINQRGEISSSIVYCVLGMQLTTLSCSNSLDFSNDAEGRQIFVIAVFYVRKWGLGCEMISSRSQY